MNHLEQVSHVRTLPHILPELDRVAPGATRVGEGALNIPGVGLMHLIYGEQETDTDGDQWWWWGGRE